MRDIKAFEYEQINNKECCVCHTIFKSKIPERWYQFCSERCESNYLHGLVADLYKTSEEKKKDIPPDWPQGTTY